MSIDERIAQSQAVFVGKVRRLLFVDSRMSELAIDDAYRGAPVLEIEVGEILFTKRDALPPLILWHGGISHPGRRVDWNDVYKGTSLIFFAGTFEQTKFKGETRLLATFADPNSARPIPIEQLLDVKAALKRREEQR